MNNLFAQSRSHWVRYGRYKIKTVKEISPELAERYKLAPSTSGVVVTDILPNSDASRKGIKIGDIIVKIDKRNIIGESAFHEYVNDARRENNRFRAGHR